MSGREDPLGSATPGAPELSGRQPLVAVLSDGFATRPGWQPSEELRVAHRLLTLGDAADADDPRVNEALGAGLDALLRLEPDVLWLDLEPERMRATVALLAPGGPPLALSPPLAPSARAAEQLLARLGQLGTRALVAHRVVHGPGLGRMAVLAHTEAFVDWRSLELALGLPAGLDLDEAPWTTRGHHRVVAALTELLAWLDAVGVEPAAVTLRPEPARPSLEALCLEAHPGPGRQVQARLAGGGANAARGASPAEHATLAGVGWTLSWRASAEREQLSFVAGKRRSERQFARGEQEHLAAVMLRLLTGDVAPPAPLERLPPLVGRAAELAHTLLYDQHNARRRARRALLAQESRSRGGPWRKLTASPATRSLHDPTLHADLDACRELCPPLRAPLRLLLVRAPVPRAADRSFPPLGLAQLAAMAGAVGAETTLLDTALASEPNDDATDAAAPSGPPGSLPAALAAKRYDLVGLSLASRDSWPEVSQTLLPALRALGAPIVLGGAAATQLLRAAAGSPPVDYLVGGEGELGLVGLMHALQGTRGWDEVPGLWDAARPTLAPRPIVVPDLGLHPTPDFRGLDLGRYRHRSPTLGRPFLPYQLLRGCRHGCTFCADESARRLRLRPVAHVLRDLRALRDRYGVHDFYLLDNLVNGAEQHLDELLDGLLDAGLDIRWCDCARPAGLERERLQRLRRAGCVELTFGVDTASPRLLGLMRKGFTVQEAEHTVRLAAEQGIAPVVNLIVGFPHETEQDFLDTVAFVERTRPFVRQFCAMAFNYTAGSPLFNEPARFGLRRCGPRFDVVGGPSWQEHREIRRQRYQRLVHEVLGQRHAAPPA